ncbi:MAG TPA: glycosyltransferase [Cyclobacteriaceae bacterium]|nr:glycosyltransferase [Cyclobacteriaceae bacterium]
MAKRVLICPLNWGLGHATRCIPVIRELERSGCEVLIAGDGDSLALLKIEFPSNRFFELPSYGISYSARIPLVLHFFSLAPKVIAAIKKERHAVSDIVAREKIDFIISDNRYGCYHPKVPSAIIIHQLNLRASPFSRLANHYNETFIKQFRECWVPDLPDHSLSGDLSANKNIAHKFIGPLSRMKKSKSAVSLQVLGLVSGPEPHRTALDNVLRDHLTRSGLSFKVVRGLPSQAPGEGDMISHLPSGQLNGLIESAEVVISRSGYSTIMDLAALHKKAIFIPTPGQTEQLYLAQEMQRKKIAPMVLQKKLSLQTAMEQLKDYTGFREDYFSNNHLQTTLREFLG